MGYEARNIITIHGLKPDKTQKLLKEIEQLANPNECYLEENNIDFTAKNFDPSELKEIAIQNPDAVIEIKTYGENEDDIWKIRYKGTEMEEIRFTELPEFTKIILPEEYPNTIETLRNTIVVLQLSLKSVAKSYVAYLVDSITRNGKKGQAVNIEALNKLAPQLRIKNHGKDASLYKTFLVKSISRDGTVVTVQGHVEDVSNLDDDDITCLVDLLNQIIKDLREGTAYSRSDWDYKECFIAKAKK